MKNQRISGGRWLVVGFALVMWMSCARGAMRNSDCLDCHSDNTLSKTNATGRALSLFVDEAKLRASAHATNTCISCHSDLTNKHPDDNVAAKPVNCRVCHERQTDSYGASVHGRAVKNGDVSAATCQDCHDSHEISPPTS